MMLMYVVYILVPEVALLRLRDESCKVCMMCPNECFSEAMLSPSDWSLPQVAFHLIIAGRKFHEIFEGLNRKIICKWGII